MKCSQMAVAARRGSTGMGSCFAEITMEMEASIWQETENCAPPSRRPGLPGMDKNAEKPEEKKGWGQSLAGRPYGRQISPLEASGSSEAREPSASGHPPTLAPASPVLPSWQAPSWNLPDSSRAFALASGRHVEQHPMTSEALHTQGGLAVGQPGC